MSVPKLMPEFRVSGVREDGLPASGEAALGDAGSSNEPSGIEEVTVRGSRSLGALRREVQAARERLYGLFNELNRDDEFDIRCRNESRAGTRIPRRVCRPAFEGNISSRAASAYLRSMLSVCPDDKVGQECLFSEYAQVGMSAAQAVEGEAPHKHQKFAEEMERLAWENPELRDAMQEYAALERRYREAQATGSN